MIFMLVRHGETSDNVLGMQGTSGNDAPLNEKGIRQATNAASIIETFHPVHIMSSPFIRCVKTAQIISDKIHIPLSQTTALKEFNMGKWSDLTFIETRRLLHANNAWDYSAEKYTFCVPGGESWKDVSRRVEDFITNVRSTYPNDSTVVIVSHSATLRAFVGIMRNRSFKDWFGFSFPNGAVSAFETKDDHYEELFVNMIQKS